MPPISGIHRLALFAGLIVASAQVSGGALAAPASGYADQIRPLEIVVDRDPSRVAAAKRLARLHAEARDWPAAWRVLERSASFAVKDAEYQGFIGTALRQLQRAPEAAAAYRRAIALQPDDGRWWVGLGLALEQNGQKLEARQAFAAARERESSLPPALRKLAERRGR
jgi:MSHA biogenesis protein MshN